MKTRIVAEAEAELAVFRYFVAYAVLNDTVWVLAIAHGRRRPEFWIERKAGVK